MLDKVSHYHQKHASRMDCSSAALMVIAELLNELVTVLQPPSELEPIESEPAPKPSFDPVPSPSHKRGKY